MLRKSSKRPKHLENSYKIIKTNITKGDQIHLLAADSVVVTSKFHFEQL